MNKSKPNYNLIFSDIIEQKYPLKRTECNALLKKANLSVLDVIELNRIIFGADKEEQRFNQNHRSYNKADIAEILTYQKKQRLNNSQLAKSLGLSRNTIAKWKKLYIIQQLNLKNELTNH